MRTNYPWQINSVIHKSKATTKTLGIEAMLFSPKGEDDVRIPAAPLEMHEGYSRFKGVLIVKDSDSNKKVLTFNIPAKTVPYIHKRTEMLIENTILTNAMKKQNTEKKEESSKAYTVLIKSGKLKDKTPAEALLEDEKNLTLLNNQKKWLEQNLAKYPTNKEQIDAINEATLNGWRQI